MLEIRMNILFISVYQREVGENKNGMQTALKLDPITDKYFLHCPVTLTAALPPPGSWSALKILNIS